MKRRDALAALAWAGSAWGSACRAAAQRDASAVAQPGGSVAGDGWHGAALAWGRGGCWIAEPGRALQALAGEASAALPPVAAARALWRVRRDGRLERWQRDGPGAWRPQEMPALEPRVHALAASPDGRFAVAAHGEQLSVLGAQGELLARFEGRDPGRTRRGAAQALFALPQRRSFVAAWPALGELWEISLDPQAPPIFEGLVHDYRMAEAIATRGYLGARRSPLGLPLPAMSFADARVPWLAGTLDDTVAVVHLDVRRRIASLRLPGALPAASTLHRSGEAWQWWLPVGDAVQRIDTARWRPIDRLPAPGPVRALQSMGEAVWALVGRAGASSLQVWRGGEWRPVELAPGRAVALAVDAPSRRVLVATEEPAALHLLDAEGRTLERWTLPAPPGAVAWMPAAG